MPHVETTKDLPIPAEHVWTVIVNPQTWSQWFAIHAGWPEKPPTTLSAGTNFVQKIAMLGMTDKLEWSVTNSVELQQLTLKGTSRTGIEVEFSFVLAPAGHGCALSVIGDFEDPILKGPLGKIVERSVGAQFAKSVEQLGVLAAA